jgi:hypothetical protein
MKTMRKGACGASGAVHAHGAAAAGTKPNYGDSFPQVTREAREAGITLRIVK